MYPVHAVNVIFYRRTTTTTSMCVYLLEKSEGSCSPYIPTCVAASKFTSLQPIRFYDVYFNTVLGIGKACIWQMLKIHISKREWRLF